MPSAESSFRVWSLISRLGEAQILLPAALLASVWLWRRETGRPLVTLWLPLLCLAILLTTASKVAFLGWGVGLPAVNFTGVSGHAMFAAAVYPLLVGAVAAPLSQMGQRLSLLAAYALALLVGVSRVEIDVHSYSEVLAGLLLGSAASTIAIALAHMPHAKVRGWLPVGLGVWLVLTPAGAPPSRTHDWVTRLSLALSGRDTPYTRTEMLNAWRQRKAARERPSQGLEAGHRTVYVGLASRRPGPCHNTC